MKLTRAGVLDIARDLDHSEGRIQDVLARFPELTDLSRGMLETMLGQSFNVFRTVMIPSGGILELESVVSATLNPLAAIGLALELPGVFFTPDSVVVREPSVLRYGVNLDRVIAFVPALINQIVREFGAKLETMRFRGVGGPTTVAETFVDVLRRQEDEVVTDVSGLTPERLTLPHRMDAYFAEKVLLGKFISGHDHIAELKMDYMVSVTDPGSAAEHYEVEAERIRRFFLVP